METKILKIATKIATPLSLASLVVLVLYLLFRAILKLPVFSQLAEGNTFLLLMAVINKLFILALVGLVLGIIAYVFVQSQAHRTSASGRFVPRRTPEARLPSGAHFSDAEFAAYRDVWVSLQDLRDAGEALWDHATKPHLSRFTQCLQDTKRKVAAGAIFFREDDYRELGQLLRYFISFHDGKESLIEYWETHPEAIPSGGGALAPNIAQTIEENRDNMVRYTQLLERLRTTYHDHLERSTAGA